MREPPLPAPWNQGPLSFLYLAALGITILIMHAAGRGWISALFGSNRRGE